MHVRELAQISRLRAELVDFKKVVEERRTKWLEADSVWLTERETQQQRDMKLAYESLDPNEQKRAARQLRLAWQARIADPEMYARRQTHRNRVLIDVIRASRAPTDDDFRRFLEAEDAKDEKEIELFGPDDDDDDDDDDEKEANARGGGFLKSSDVARRGKNGGDRDPASDSERDVDSDEDTDSDEEDEEDEEEAKGKAEKKTASARRAVTRNVLSGAERRQLAKSLRSPAPAASTSFASQPTVPPPQPLPTTTTTSDTIKFSSVTPPVEIQALSTYLEAVQARHNYATQAEEAADLGRQLLKLELHRAESAAALSAALARQREAKTREAKARDSGRDADSERAELERHAHLLKRRLADADIMFASDERAELQRDKCGWLRRQADRARRNADALVQRERFYNFHASEVSTRPRPRSPSVSPSVPSSTSVTSVTSRRPVLLAGGPPRRR